jgi:hypothetical protein
MDFPVPILKNPSYINKISEPGAKFFVEKTVSIDKENGTAETFVRFIAGLIISGFVLHEEVLVMDNAKIHTGGGSGLC